MATALQVRVTKTGDAWNSGLRATIRMDTSLNSRSNRPWVAQDFERGFLYLILLQGRQVALMGS